MVRFNDGASYVTEISAITNPVELGFSYSQESAGDEDVSFISNATSALTGLTGWTSANGAAMTEVSELGASEANFHASRAPGAYGDEISFETSPGEIEVQHARSRSGRNKAVSFNSPANRGGRFFDDGGSVGGASYGSRGSHGSKKRDPVPPMKDPNMDDKEEDQMWEEDCNYDINPSLLFLVLESRDWQECISLLDGKGLQNKNEVWNLGQLFGGKKKEVDEKLAEKRKMELKQQTRTWIVRREKNGLLRWRMLPLHAALAFNAPFEVVLRLYHLYPGAVRCRDDQGMIPMHHVFRFGSEDRVLELFLAVFPEALTVVDDKGRLPLACTLQDGSENERRSNILTLFSNFQVELAVKEMEKEENCSVGTEEGDVQKTAGAKIAIQPTQSSQSETLSTMPDPPSEGTLGATPRYTSGTDYTPVTYGAIKPLSAKRTPPKKKAVPQKPLSPKENDKSDRYALLDGEDSENVPMNGQGGLGMLSPIPEDEEDDSLAKRALKSELLALGEKKKKRGLKKMFRKKLVI